MLLEVRNLKVQRNKEEILKGIDLKINSGEVQALLGPNASGKSTLAQVILGNPKYKVSQGKIFFKRKPRSRTSSLRGMDITKFSPEKRVKLGMAMAWQSPPAVKGVKLSRLLEKVSTKKVKNEKLDIDSNLLEREVNLDFSGGEKKLSELLQILSLNPKFVIFDEIDSGLDLKKVEKVAKIIKKELIEKGASVLLITHSGQILNFLKPDITNVMLGGKIICKEKDFKKVLRTIKRYGYEKCKRCSFLAN